ncbi:unnamed protein product [Toxocara canis]|uniref:RNA-binding protein Nova-1 n=1 Tax=Toxocara canis TaxID=6265 RepID=A0A183VED3_TOXCA|nr:unnamed protein product [Toxocara canis]
MEKEQAKVSDADLRTHLSGGEAVETVVSGATAGDAFQQATAIAQSGPTVTYVSSGQASLTSSEGDFVQATAAAAAAAASQAEGGVLIPQGTDDGEQTPQSQHISTMDAYPLAQHINTAYWLNNTGYGTHTAGGREWWYSTLVVVVGCAVLADVSSVGKEKCALTKRVT